MCDLPFGFLFQTVKQEELSFRLLQFTKNVCDISFCVHRYRANISVSKHQTSKKHQKIFFKNDFISSFESDVCRFLFPLLKLDG